MKENLSPAVVPPGSPMIPPAIEQLIASIGRLNPLQTRYVMDSVSLLNVDELDFLERYVLFYEKEGVTINQLADCYQVIVRDAMREQVYFAKHGRYRMSSFAEACAKVYHNPGYMFAYMHGLILTQFLWPNHVRMARWFLEKLPRGRAGAYLEIGPGHGFFFMNAMRHGSFASYEGIDISQTSIALTEKLVQCGSFGKFDRYRLHQADFLAHNFDRKYSAITMGEVLEHVERPELFLRRIRELASPGAFIYLSTVINAPMIDHIHLFESVTSIRRLLAETSLSICDQLVLPSHGLTIEECERQRLAVNIAFVLAPV
jgi:2-polyprenyl-3-methyl-5-hydroxy-6-metoxy-1,4-benzoquinol methylase